MFANKVRHSIIWVGKDRVALIESLIYGKVWKRLLRGML
jgi:hypothetical protein